MKLNRRYFRNIKENLSFYTASTVLTVVTLLFFFLYSVTGNAIIDFSKEFFERNKLENAHFETYLPLSDEKIEEFEKTYDLDLEAQKFVNIETDGVTSRVFKKTHKVDLYEITEGKDVQKDTDLVISEGFAVNNGIKIGDKRKIGDKEYTVCGFMQRPDYLYMLETENDAYKNVTTFYLCYMTDNAFDELGATNVQYLVRYGDESKIIDFRKAVHEEALMRSYSADTENLRISMVREQADLFILMAYLMLCVLPLITVTLICIIISRKVKSEQKMIGALSAMGYKKSQLMRHYAGFAAIPGILGGILTTVISLFAVQPYGEAGLMDYEPMRVVGRLKPLDVVLAIVVPTVIYIIAGALTVHRLLKKDTVLLLNGSASSEKKKTKKLLVGKKGSFRTKFALRSLLGNPARSFVVILGIFLGCFIMLWGFGMVDTMKHTAKTASSDLGSYEYEYVLNELKEENPYGGETLLLAPAEDKDGHIVSIVGTDKDNKYLDLKDEAGKEINPENGFYATSLVKLAFGWEKGDKIKLLNPITLEENEITVTGIIENNAQKAVYTSKEKASALAGLDENRFNAIISEKPLSVPEEKIAQTVRLSDMEEQVENMLSQMGSIVWLALLLGVIMCVAAVYVAVNMLVTENRGNISMLKVLGYTDRMIDRIVLNVHHLLVPIGILLSIPAAYAFCQAFEKLYIAYGGAVYMTTYLSPLSFLIAIALTVISYVLSLLFIKRKVKKVDMTESLKDNRE